MDTEDESTAIECRAAVAIEAAASNELVFLPVGLHAIKPASGGIGRPIKVMVDARTAGEIERQRGEITTRTGKRVYFDFNHEDGPASFWPESFTWRAKEGVVAKGEWSASGKRAVEGKDYRTFSPVFHVDDKRKDPARVICCEQASPNMGGLVNDPAFKTLAIWSKNDGSPVTALEQPANNNKKETKMTADEIAALRAKHQELEIEVKNLTALVAQDAEDETTKTKLTAAEAEAKSTALEIEMAGLRAKEAQQAATIEKRNRADADTEIKAAVLRGAILPKDTAMQEKWRVQLIADPATFTPMLRAVPGPGKGLGERYSGVVSKSGASVVNDDPTRVYVEMARLLSQSARSTSREEKFQLGTEFSAIYAGAFAETERNREQRTRLVNSRLNIMDEAIKAADITDANLGTIAGTLVTQKTLELLKFKFPALIRFTTDFSDQPATYNQTIMTRIVGIPALVTYSTATGWADTPATTTDVPIVLNSHRGVQITFGENLLASTMRRLFDEFAEAQAYSLAKGIIDSLYANFTDANYTNNTLSTSAAFLRTTVIDIGVALEQRGVPLGLGARTMLLWPPAFGSLKKDPTLSTFATYQEPRVPIITEGTQPDTSLGISVDSFQVFSAPNMPSNNANLVGFAGSKSAVCIVTRTPSDYASILPGASYGNVQMVTDPDINITVMQVQFVNHTMGTASSRIALMWGTAAGQTNAGQLIKASAGSGSSR